MIARRYLDSDYITVCKWWDKYNCRHLQKDLLSTTGYIVEDVMVAWLYRTDSSFSIIAWPVSNKEASKADKKEAFKLIVKKCESKSREDGYKIITTFTNHDDLVDKYEEEGFILADGQMINLMKGL